jgi:DNA replication and repair protein RecF
VTALRSFRTVEHRLLVRRGENEAAVAWRFEHEELGGTPVRVRLQAGTRQVWVDEEKVERLADVIGRFPTVVFSSDDIQLVRGGPAGRRRWMDLVLSAADPEYFRALQRYHQALKMRNSLLKRRAAAAEIHSFETILAPQAATLLRLRRSHLEDFAVYLKNHYGAIAAGREDGSMQYRPDLPLESGNDFLRHWTEARPKDLQYAATQRGPHRDDLVFQVSGRSAREYGSEGQQRGLVLALRLAQVDYFRARLRLAPVLLADDIVNELDPVRRESFWRGIGDDLQLIATGTVPPGGGGWQVFSVEEGTFTAR